VWIKGISARAGRPLNRGRVNVPINIGGLVVKPRDLTKADVHGVVIIPSNEVVLVAKRVKEILAKERFLERGIKEGQRLSELLSDFPS
jgi:regulator of RNase E activity RraA